MKKIFIFSIFLFMGTYNFALPLSQEARQESQLFNTFLEAAYAQRRADPSRFAKLRRALKQAPNSSYIKQQLVSEALAVDELELADHYADFIEDASQDPEAWAVYGAYQWRKGNSAQAIEAYEKATELAPEDDLILFQYITVLSATQPDKAAQTLEELAQARPMIASDLYNEMGRMYFYHQNFPAALEAFNKGVKADPANPQPRLGRAGVYEKTNQYFFMLHELEDLEKMGFSNAQTWAQMGAVYVLVRDFERAEQCFIRAKQDDNGSLPAGHFLALISEERGDYEKAISYLKDTHDYAQSPAKQIQVSYYQRKLNRPQESLQTVAAAYKQFADNTEVAYLYAVALYEDEQYKRAARILAPLVQKYPDNSEIRLQYAFTLESLKKYRAMEQEIAVLLEQNPRNAAALNLLAYSLAQRGQRLDEAADLSARALAVWPQDPSLIDTQAWILYKQGHYEQASDLMHALPAEFVAANPEISYHIALIEQALGQPQTAQTYLQQAASGGWKPAQKELKKSKKILEHKPVQK
ncbi:MAG: tetratricopeptide repeat protein [Elusimicrobiaceae bacterium]|nr:tetratricopeptide repeat protein [Elusimicrobiaceae bacterium]